MNKRPKAQSIHARAALFLIAVLWLQTATAQTSTAPLKPASAAVATPSPPATPLTVRAPVPAPVEAGVRVLLSPDVETILLAQAVGRITTLNGSLGSRVNKGQLVVGMDCTESAARLKMSQAELASARETYDSKVRLKGLDAAGDIEVSLAAAAVARADGQIEMTKAQIQNCSVFAPFSGRIVKLHVKPFQGVNAGQPLFELVSDGAPRLRLNVPSKWLRSIKIEIGRAHV